MLTGRLPYGAEVAKARTRAQQRRLRYASALDDNREIPAWIDEVLKKALQPDPCRRYDELSEFIHDLRHPAKTFVSPTFTPLIERNPLLFWKATSLVFAIIILLLLISRHLK